MKSIRENILKYGVLILIFILPLLCNTNLIFPHVSIKTFFFYGSVEFLTCFWLYSIIIDKSYRISKKSLIYITPVFLYTLWMTLATIFAVNPELALWSSVSRGVGLLTLYHTFVFMLIVMSLVRKYSMPYVYSLMKCFVNGGFFVALTVWFGSTGFNLPFKALTTDTGGGLTGNSSLAGAYFIFIIGFAICLLFSKSISKRGKWWVATILATIMFSPIFIDLYGFLSRGGILEGARGALLGLIVGGLASIAIYTILSKKKILKFLGAFLILSGVLSFSFLWNNLITPDTYLHNKFIEVAKGTRFIFWDEASKAMHERPWFGYGPENYSIAFQKYFNPKMVLAEYNHEGWNDRAHNVYYDTGVSGGYPAIILYGLFFAVILYAVYSKRNIGQLNNMQISVVFGVVLGYIFQDLFYFDSVLSLMSLFALAGIAFSLGLENKTDKEKSADLNPILKNTIAIIITLVFIPIFIHFTYSPYKKIEIITKVVTTTINKPFDKLLGGSVIGNQWDMSGMAHDAYNLFAKDPVKTKNNKEVLPYIQKDLANMIKYFEKLSEINKTDYRLYISIIHLYSTDIYFADKKYDPILAKHMLDILDHAKELAPTNPEVYWGIAQVDAWSGDFKGIEKAYKDAIALDRTVPVSYKLLIQFAEAVGNKKLYNDTFAEAKKNIPNFDLN